MISSRWFLPTAYLLTGINSMKIIKQLIFTFVFFSHLFGKNYTFTVLDHHNNEPIDKVNVVLISTDIGTTTNEKGFCLLQIPQNIESQKVLFSHIAYEDVSINLSKLTNGNIIYLKSKSILFDNIEVDAEYHQRHYNQNIYNKITSIDESKLEIRGYADVKDLLITDQSINISEQSDGTTNLSVRGSNSEEILILFDGVKINNDFNNLFDFSIIDPANLKRIDLIKGSSAITNNSLSHSATINLIPKEKQDYHIKFDQQFGSYNSGDWRLHLSQNIKNLSVFGSFNQGGAIQNYEGMKSYDHIVNSKENHLLNLQYNFGKQINHKIGMKYLYSGREYENKIYLENMINDFELYNVNYKMKHNFLGESSIQYSIKKLKEERNYIRELYQIRIDGKSEFDNNTQQLQFSQNTNFNTFDFRFSWLNENSDMDYSYLHFKSFEDHSLKTNPSKRALNNILFGVQFINKNGSNDFAMKNIKYDISFDFINDELMMTDSTNSEKKWVESSNNLTIAFNGMHNQNVVNGYMNFSISNTIPTLYQQLNYNLYRQSEQENQKLEPEYKKNMEIGIVYYGKISEKYGYFQLTGNLFRTDYTNKFRTIKISKSPVQYFDNFKETTITGIESSFQMNLFHKKIIMNLGVSKYFTPDELTFSFKADRKVSAGIATKLNGFSGEITWFAESDRIGFVLDEDQNMLHQINLDKFNNFDVHLAYQVEVFSQFIKFSFSCKNLLRNDEMYEGISIHDRRFYLSCGFEL